MATQPDATDLVFMGELRLLKGIDVLIDAIAQLRSSGRSVTATLVGDGPDRDAFQRAGRAGSASTDAVRFCRPCRRAQALALGRIMVVPSRAESLPYVVLEAAAAGMPLIATNVGGIPEIFGPLADPWCRRTTPQRWPAPSPARSIDPTETADIARQAARAGAGVVFSRRMVDGVLAAYRTALEALR